MEQFTASDGARIAYRDEGRGRPLVFLHGLMANSRFFDRQRPLAEDYRLVAVDLRGHGESRGAGGGRTVERLAADVAELAGKLDLTHAIGIGWSLGATVLWSLLAGPEASRFAGAIVVDMTPRVLNDQGWTLGLTRDTCEARTAAIRGDFRAFAAGAGRAIFAAPGRDAEWAAAEFAANDQDAVGELWESLVEQDLRGSLAAIRQPTLIVRGAHSHLYGARTADYLVEALPSAASIEFDSSGHAPHLEQPELFNATLRDFAAMLPPIATEHVTA